MENQNNVNTKPAIKPEISFEDFMKADIRMCKILSVEKVEGADKLYKLVIDTGIDTRVVVSAVAHKLKAEDLLLSTMPFILNLPPRKIKGIESFGMIIMAEDSATNYLPIKNNLAEAGSIVI